MKSPLLAITALNPYEDEPLRADITSFVSVLPRRPRPIPLTPINLPRDGRWLMRIVTTRGRFAFGEYRRHMRTIGYLGSIDRMFGMPVTTRNWNTLTAIIKALTNKDS